MADFLTHILLSDDVMDKIESRRILEGVTKKRALYRLGAQGPDPFFFWNCFPGNGKGELRELGDTMHRKATGAFLKYGFGRLADNTWDESWIDLAVYLSGFVCHYTLDRIIHPYVWWGTHEWIWSMDGTPVKTTHMEIEMSLDVLLWRELRGSPACKVRTKKLVDVGKRWPPSVERFLMEAVKELYGLSMDEKASSKVLNDFYRGHEMLYDPKGWKKALVNWLDAFTGGAIKPAKPPIPAKANETVDWANKKHRTWTNPFVEGEEHHKSVYDLLARASFEASNHINAIFSRLQKGEALEDLFPDISYDTGLPLKAEE